MKPESGREKLMNVFLKRYSTIRQSCDEEILERVKQEGEYYESFEWFCKLMQNKDPDQIIETMEQTSLATEQILCRIDDAIEEYADIAKREGLQSWRQYDALYSIYFSTFKLNIKDISKKYRVKKSIVYKDIKEAKNRFVTILFRDSECGNVDNYVDE